MKGFFNLGDYEFTSDQHHGTPQERLNMVVSGYKSRDLPMPTAFQYSIQYVTTYTSSQTNNTSDAYAPTVVSHQAHHSGQLDETSDLQRVISMTFQKRLAELRGSIVGSEGDEWNTKLQAIPPLMCTISKDESSYAYECKRIYKTKEDAAQAAQAVEDIVTTLVNLKDKGVSTTDRERRHKYSVDDVLIAVGVHSSSPTMKHPYWDVSCSIFHN